MKLTDLDVLAYRLASDASTYPSAPPFSPNSRYPECPFDDVSPDSNDIYHAIRQVFALSGLDTSNANTDRWNPLGELIHPGETVVLKPNFIKERHPTDPEGWQWILTHGSIIRAVADYVFLAVGSTGRVMVADAPQTDSSFDAVLRVLGMPELVTFYERHGHKLEVLDLRQEEWVNKGGVIVKRTPLPGDPSGNVAYDLADASEFCGHRGGGRYYGADYDDTVVNHHHTGGRHEYALSRSVMLADVVFSLPKLKTHKKAGITASLKNLVGVNGDKNWLPHHTEGHPTEGGDEHPQPGRLHRVERRAAAALRRLSLALPIVGTLVHRQARMIGSHVFGDTEAVVRSGNWWGNDTVWRMCLDLNKIVFYGEPDGTLRSGSVGNRRRHFVLVDGVIAGQGSGPSNPDRMDAGVVLFGTHPASVDAAAATIMGYDPERIPIVREAFRCLAMPLAEWGWREVRVVSNVADWNAPLAQIPCSSLLHFKPHFAWVGHIERVAAPVS